ncbi:MAG: hypothetical protein QOE14_2177, partial [Humisphaera sp.]|nr:hypothetical protein [Humisphaera sp.]
AFNGTARGTTALITTDPTPNQTRLAQIAGGTVETEMVALNSTHESAWASRSDTGSGAYGEIGNGNLNSEMDGTIIEVAFHDNVTDANLLKDPRVRNDVGRATTHVAIKYFDEFDATFTTLTYAPEPPREVRATTTAASGNITLSWQAGLSSAGTTGPYGNAATGYRVWTSTNGYGFDLAATLGNVTTTTLSGLPTNAVTYFMITAINAGGESLKSWTVAAKPQTGRRAPVLIVNNFQRLDRQGDAIESEYFGTVSRVYLRHNNTFDYVVQAGEAIENHNNQLGIETATDDAIAAGTISLSNYHTVIWLSGEQSTGEETFSATTQPMVTSYLAAGGKLFVSGAEVAWDLFGQTAETQADRDFLANALHSTYVDDDALTYTTAAGIAGTPLAGVPALSFDNGTHGTYDVDFADVIGAASGATVAMNYSTGGGAVVTWTGSGISSLTTPKVINMGFPFESVYTASQRNSLMSAALAYFGTNETILTATPTGVDLVAFYDSGQSDTDNRTNRTGSAIKPLEFQVTGTITGAAVRIYFGSTLIGSATATGATTNVTITGASLSGAALLTATQSEAGKAESLKSAGFTLTIDTTPLAAPAAPSVVTTSPTSISLDWADVAGTDVWGYDLYRADSAAGPYTKLNATPFAASSYVDNSVIAAQTYHYRVRSIDTAGNESGDSGTTSVAALDPSAASATPDLAATSDSGWDDADDYTSFDNSSPAKALEFTVGNTIPGSLIEIYSGSTLIGSTTATGTSTTITTDGSTALLQGARNITARQTEPGKNPTASPVFVVTIDTIAPSAPTTPDLSAGSDSGSSSTDNYTNDSTPTFVVGGDAASRPELLLNGAPAASSFTGSGSFDVTFTSAIGDGVHSIAARMIDRAGNVGAAAATLGITIDTLAPAAPSTPDLRSDTDSGSSSSDDLTKISTPSFTGTGEAGSTIGILVDSVLRGSGAATGGNYDIAAGPLAQGANVVTARSTDLAGNVSAASGGLTVTLDAIAPTAAVGSETPVRGAATLDFTVTYTDATSLIDPSTLGNDDITVVGPDSTAYAATLIDAGTGGSSRVVTYRITAPGGTWNSDDAGV